MAAQFLSKLIFEDDNGLPFTLFQAFVYKSELLKRIILVPVGFKTDLASIPRILWNILPPIGNYDRAAVLHDFLYNTGGMKRKDADSVLREAMDVAGVSHFIRWTIYSGVRIGGWVPWNKYRHADKDA